MNQSLPFVSVVVPCRNEAGFIARCLESLLANDYPFHRLEILVIDGESDDGTGAIVEELARKNPVVRLVRNPARIIPAAMNTGIRHARGSIILKIDAHADYDSDYLSACVRRMQEYGADCVGGVLTTLPSKPSVVGRVVASVLSHGFGSGDSSFRTGADEPVWADTAAFGCYRRDVFERVGMYDERLVRSSDMDLNTRLRAQGGRILLAPDIRARYYCRAELGDFFRRNLLDGFWALYPIRFGSRLTKVRHVLPVVCLAAALFLLVVGLLWAPAWWTLGTLAALYASLAVLSGLQLALQTKELQVVALAPVVFAIRHGAYAIGAAWGALRGITGRCLMAVAR